jgi:hypothetical protein
MSVAVRNGAVATADEALELRKRRRANQSPVVTPEFPSKARVRAEHRTVIALIDVARLSSPFWLRSAIARNIVRCLPDVDAEPFVDTLLKLGDSYEQAIADQSPEAGLEWLALHAHAVDGARRESVAAAALYRRGGAR